MYSKKQSLCNFHLSFSQFQRLYFLIQKQNTWFQKGFSATLRVRGDLSDAFTCHARCRNLQAREWTGQNDSTYEIWIVPGFPANMVTKVTVTTTESSPYTCSIRKEWWLSPSLSISSRLGKEGGRSHTTDWSPSSCRRSYERELCYLPLPKRLGTKGVAVLPQWQFRDPSNED